MKYIDMHCDTVMMGYLANREKPDLYDINISMVDFKRMKQGDRMAQFFAVFVTARDFFPQFGVPAMEDDEYIDLARKIIVGSTKAHDDIIRMAYSARDIEKNRAEGKMSAVLTMEDGRSVDGKLEKLKKYYDDGFRAISLTWNFENCFGFPNSDDARKMNLGLKDFGKEAVEYMQELGILVDVSHLSEGGFWDVADICKKPFVATHSDARALGPHQRNLSDRQIKALGDAGGVAGLNFGPEFLNSDVTCKDSTAALIAKHARHMADVGGVEVVGIGSDFDGIQGNLEVSGSDKMPLLVDALSKEGFSEDNIEKIFCKNVLRVMKDALK